MLPEKKKIIKIENQKLKMEINKYIKDSNNTIIYTTLYNNIRIYSFKYTGSAHKEWLHRDTKQVTRAKFN